MLYDFNLHSDTWLFSFFTLLFSFFTWLFSFFTTWLFSFFTWLFSFFTLLYYPGLFILLVIGVVLLFKQRPWLNFKASFFRFLGLILLTIVIVFVLADIYTRHIPTQIRLDLTVREFSFRLSEDKRFDLEDVDFSSINVMRFSEVEFNQKELELYSKKSNEQWEPIPSDSFPLILGTENSNLEFKPNGNMEPVLNTVRLGILKDILLDKGDKVTFKVEGEKDKPNRLIIDIEKNSKNNKSPVKLTISTKFELNGSGLKGTTDAYLKGTLKEENNSTINIKHHQDESLGLDIKIIPDKATWPLVTEYFFIDSLDLTIEKMHPYPSISALIETGEISYPQYPEKGKLLIEDSDFLESNDKNQFLVEKLLIDPNHPSLKLRLQGKVEGKSIHIYPIGFEKEQGKPLSLTRYDTFTNDPFSKILFEFFIWAIPVLLAMLAIWNPFQAIKAKEEE